MERAPPQRGELVYVYGRGGGQRMSVQRRGGELGVLLRCVMSIGFETGQLNA